MAALFLLMIVPTSAWYFLAELTSGERFAALPAADQALLAAAQRDVQTKLALALVATVVVFAAIVAYLRRTLVDPLADLARRARAAGRNAWTAPPQLDRPDELGDLARALDAGVTELERRAEEALGFSINLGHELRTPLAAIRGAAEILAEEELSEPERARFVGNIVTESARLERLVEGILELSRTGRKPIERPVEISDLVVAVAAVLDVASPLLDRKALHVEQRILADASDGARVAVRRDSLQRILVGLLENAIRHSPRDGTIRVEVTRSGAEWRAAIADDGPGIPPALREKIFERRFTTERDGGASARGAGLGLAIVRSLVAAASGRVEVDGTTERGARFVVTFPAA